MVYLRLDGFTISDAVKADSPSKKFDRLGMRGRAYDGTKITHERARKRVWDLETVVRKELEAIMLEGLIDGLGQSWSFDEHIFGTLKAAGPGSTAGAVRFGGSILPAAGTAVELAYVHGDTVADSKFGTGSLSVDAGCTNILTLIQRTCQGALGGEFVVLATAGVTANTTRALEGTGSLRISSAAVADGVETVPVTATPNIAYVGSGYIFPTSGNLDIRIRLIDDVGTVVSTDFVTVLVDQWSRLETTGTTDVAATDLKMEITCRTAGAQVFFVDALQVETGAVATTWADGVRANGDLAYPIEVVNSEDNLTVNFWAKLPTANPAGVTTLIKMITEGTPVSANQFLISRSAATNDLVFTTRNRDGTSTNLITFATAPWDGDWHMVTAVLNATPEDSDPIKELYFDGVSVGTSNPGAFPTLPEVDLFEVGNSGGTTQLNDGLIDDLIVRPFVVTAALVTAWFTAGDTDGKGLAQLPRMFMDGDIVPRGAYGYVVEGEVMMVPSRGGFIDGVYRPNAVEIKFTLAEV